MDPGPVITVELVDMNLRMAAYYGNWNATLGVALLLEMKHRSQPLKISCGSAAYVDLGRKGVTWKR